MTPHDLIVPLGTGSPVSNWELRWLMRSADACMKGIGRVVVVGIDPGFLNPANTIHIPASDDHALKSANITRKMLLACNDDRLSPAVVIAADDHLFLQPIAADQIPAIYRGNLAGDLQHRNTWRRNLEATRQYLAAKHKSWRNYDIPHCPRLVDRADFAGVVGTAPFEDPPGLLPTSLYFNLRPPKEAINIAQETTRIVRLVKFSDAPARLGHPDALFGNYTDDALRTRAVTRYLEKRYPQASKFERD